MAEVQKAIRLFQNHGAWQGEVINEQPVFAQLFSNQMHATISKRWPLRLCLSLTLLAGAKSATFVCALVAQTTVEVGFLFLTSWVKRILTSSLRGNRQGPPLFKLTEFHL